MRHSGIDLPHGYRLAFFDSIDSTNAEALREAQRGEAGGLWIWAAEQQNGRGRAGRSWSSRQGGLYASLMLRPSVPLAKALHLPFVAGVAAHDAILSLAAGLDVRPDVRLKWPNDILLAGAKLGGILLESASSGTGETSVVVIGTGINLSKVPGDLDRPAASLAQAGIRAGAAEAFAALAWTTAEWLAVWDDGAGFDLVRSAWLERAQAIGERVTVRLGHESVAGVFLGIDETGALRLSVAGGAERRITAGDVMLANGV